VNDQNYLDYDDAGLSAYAARLHAATQHYKDELAGAVDSCEPSLRMRQLADRLMHGHSG
jgi:hypothetical protein